MSVKDFHVCILKYKKFLSILVAASILICYMFMYVKQTYTAQVYIKYLGDAESGVAQDGSKLNPYEIANGYVVSMALKDLGVTDVSSEAARKSITVTPVVPSAEEEKYAAWIDNFNDYSQNEDAKLSPVFYSVTFRTDRGADFASLFLSALVDRYRVYYAENFAYNTDIPKVSDSEILKYDYYEAAALLADNVESNIDRLGSIANADSEFRSSVTGYTPSDLVSEYKLLLNTEIASVCRDIYENGISKDVSLLHSVLENKSDAALLESDRNAEKADTEKELMLIYSEKNKEYTWDTHSEYDQVRDDTERDKIYVRDESTYDSLMLDYVDYATLSSELLFDKDNYTDFAEHFKMDSTSESVEKSLKHICAEYNRIHGITEQTVKDYNSYKSASHIQLVSGISAGETIVETIYYAAAVIFALGVGITICIAIELVSKKKI